MMSPELRSLFAKEWSERRSLLKVALSLMLVTVGYCLAYEIEYRTRALIASFYSCCATLSYLGAVLLAMSTAAGESSRGTLKFTSSLPVSLRQVAWVRLIGAWGCLVIPILAGAVIMTILFLTGAVEQGGLRETPYVRFIDRGNLSTAQALGFLWTTVLLAVLSAMELTALLSLVGTRCRGESQVGFWGAVTLALWFVLTELRLLATPTIATALAAFFPQSLAISWGYGEIDGSQYSDLELSKVFWPPLAGNLVVIWVLGIAFARSYGRAQLKWSTQSPAGGPSSRRRWRLRLPVAANIRLPGRVGSLVWLDLRQSLPLCLAGLMLAIMITLLEMIGVHARPGDTGMSQEGVMTSLARNLPSTAWFIGILWSALVGVGIFNGELQSGLEQFWRSRPISSGSWFWTKLLVGLGAVLIVLDAIPIYCGWRLQNTMESGYVGYAYLACFPALHSLIYLSAVAAVCWLRRPILAAILAFATYYIMESVMDSIPGQTELGTVKVFNTLEAAERLDGTFSLLSGGYPIVYGFVALLMVISILAARRGVSLFAAVLLILGTGAQPSLSAEPVDMARIVEEQGQREGRIKDLHLRYQLKTERTPFHSDRLRVFDTSNQETITQESMTYDLFEKLPLRRWSEFGDDGTLKRWTAYDGSLVRVFQPLKHRGIAGTIYEQRQPLEFGTFRPEHLEILANSPLRNFLASADHPPTVLQWRQVNGEHLVDLKLDGIARPTGQEFSPQRFQATINVSRQCWPIFTRTEHATTPEGSAFMVVEMTATGWIEAGSVIYPRHIEKRTLTTRPTSSNDWTPPGDSPLQLDTTQILDVLDIAINQDISEASFAPEFPPDSIFNDVRDRKIYAVNERGMVQPYVPQPSGVRGAVLVYHICWMTILGGYGWWRSRSAVRTGPAKAVFADETP